MYSLYFLFPETFNEKLNRKYIWKNLHKHEGERNMHSPDILEKMSKKKKRKIRTKR